MKKAGLNVEIFSGGGTGTYNIMPSVPGVTDVQVGSYMFMDMQYLAIGSESGDAVYTDFVPSLTVLTTVLNNRFQDRLTTDAGAKALTLNTPTAGVIGEPGMEYNAGSDEFGRHPVHEPADESLQDRRPPRGHRAALRSGRERIRSDVRDPQREGRSRLADHGPRQVSIASPGVQGAKGVIRVSTPAAVLLAALAVAAIVPIGAQDFELVVLNGRVVDPESGLDAIRSVGISGGKIAAISDGALKGRRTIDAAGLVVAPGFIDLHEHGQTDEAYRYEAADGVTTSFELEVGTGDVDRWYKEREPGRLINYGVSVGHIQVRMAVLHDPSTFLPSGDAAHKVASPAEIAEMVRRIDDGLRKGAVAVGLGPSYTAAATQWEILEVFRAAARHHASRARAHPRRHRGPRGSHRRVCDHRHSAPRGPHQQLGSGADSRDASDHHRSAIARSRRDDRGLSVHGRHERDPVCELRRAGRAGPTSGSPRSSGRSPASGSRERHS